MALMMQDIDESYKLVEEMSGYYKYKKKQWKKILAAGETIEKVTESRYGSNIQEPEDPRYEKQMELMEVEAEKNG